MPADTIKKQLPLIPKTSGVYQFFDAKNQVLYVGKAKNLLNRIKSYTEESRLSPRISRMVFLTEKLEFIQTENEVEALLLEHNLIKKLSPKFNILLRDDKTFPYIEISNHQFPRIIKNRNFSKEKLGNPKIVEKDFFGPFASAHDVNRSIDILRKIFLLRNCSDSEFNLRKKPCLEYQIKKCSAPCVGFISAEEYKISVRNAADFLSGKSAEIQQQLGKKMHLLSQKQNYEQAAFVRDQIKSLNAIQTKQNINISDLKNSDVVIIVKTGRNICAYISFYRAGQNYGAKPYFYEFSEEKNITEFAEEFLGQFYLTQIPPKLIWTNIKPDEKKLLEEFLSKISGQKTEIKIPKKGDKLALIKDQEAIAKQHLEQKISQNLSNTELLAELKTIFHLPKIPHKIEVYDNSHTSNNNAVGAMISANKEGFIKSDYRKFNIGKETFADEEKFDDTAMMREVFWRRFSKLQKKDYPDLIIIDGGKPQLNAVKKVFDKLSIKIPFIAMAKGENRNAGEERFFKIEKENNIVQCAKDLAKNHPAIYYLQRLRDEAHRFAITTHRAKRKKSFKASG